MPVALGALIPFTSLVKDANGDPLDAVTVQLVVTRPDGTTAGTYTLAGTTVAHPAPGTYTRDEPATAPGLWTGVWTSTSPAGSYVEAFHVEDQLGPLVSLAEVKNHLKITAAQHDELLSWFAAVASDVCEQYTGRAWRRRTVVDRITGGHSALLLTHAPVVSITSITDNGAAVDASTYALDDRAGVIYRNAGLWGSYPTLGITVTYVAGDADQLPPRTRHGVLEMVRHLWESQRGGTGAPRQGQNDTWSTLMGFSVPRRVAELWDLDRLPGFA